MADLDPLAALYRELTAAHGRETTPAEARAKLAARLGAGCQAALAEAAGQPPAGAAVWIDVGDHVYLTTFVIAERQRRRGLGRRLFAALRDGMIGRGRIIRLEAWGAAPQGFWRAQGFAVRAETFELGAAMPGGAGEDTHETTGDSA